MKSKIKLAVTILAITIFTVVSSYASYYHFATPNFVRAAACLTKVYITDNEYAEVRSNPRVVIAKPNDDNAMKLFEDTLISEGYEFVDEERLGSLITVQKNGKSEQIHFSANKYYSLWEWL